MKMNNNCAGLSEKDNQIMNRLKEHYEEAMTLGHEVFAIVVQGSQNYGLDLDTKEYKSDIDTKCIIIPSFEELVNNSPCVSYTHERLNSEHIDVKDIRIMFDTFKKQNVNFVEILFSDYYIVPDKYRQFWSQLQELAEDLVHAHPAQLLRTISGMSMEKRKALKHPYPTIKWKIDKWGYDGKQLHHIIRLNDFIKSYLKPDTTFKEALYPLDKLDMIKAKLNLFTLSEAEEIAQQLDEETKFIKNNYIEKNGDVITNVEPYNKLDALKYHIIKQRSREEILLDLYNSTVDKEKMFYDILHI